MKSKEPKEIRKSTPKPRKGSEKSKRPPLEAVNPTPPEPQSEPFWSESGTSLLAAVVIEHGNGASDPALVAESGAAELDPPFEVVQARAYELFVERGYEHGYHMEDWLTAEREMKSRNRAA